MKAVVMDGFGGTDQLRLANIPTPQPKDSEVLIQVAAAAVNPVDWKIREGFLKSVLPHQFPVILGWDAAGTVKSVGKDVRTFKPGDRVYSYCRKPVVQWGTYAEYVAMDESAVAPAPKNLTLAEAASFPLTALTAWQALFDTAKLTKGQTVLIHAGAGGVGGVAIQLAKHFGARVITTASEAKHSYVKELGAEAAIDYTKEDVAAKVREFSAGGVDVVFDCAGGETLKKSYEMVCKGGFLVGIVDTPDAELSVKLGIRSQYVFVAPNGAELREIGALIEQHKVRPLAIEEFPLEAAAAAHKKSESHRTRGKLILKIH